MISNRHNNRNTDIRNNPTANRSLQQVETKYNSIKSSVYDLKNLKLLCTRCTGFEKDQALNKVYMIHDERNELYRCPQCNNVSSENQIRYALRLELPEYIYYNKGKDIKEIKKQREEEEKFIIRPINEYSPDDLSRKTGVRTVKNKPTNNNNINPSSTD